MTITGITDDGKYEVSTWGMKLYYDPVKNEGDIDLHLKLTRV